MVKSEKRKKVGEIVNTHVYPSLTIPPERYVTVVLPDNGKFNYGDSVLVVVVHRKDFECGKGRR